MRPGFLFANLISVLCLFASCASSKVVEGDGTVHAAPIIRASEFSQKYNMQLDFMKHHFSGLLIVKELPDHEIRILASTYFGLSLFDFSLRDEEFHVNSCIDFKNLFLNGKDIRIKKKNSTFEKRATGRGFGKSVFYLSEFISGHPEQIKIKHPWLRLSIQLDKLKEKQD